MAMGAILSTNFKNYDLPVDGSPINKIFMSPLNFILSGNTFLVPKYNKKSKNRKLN